MGETRRDQEGTVLDNERQPLLIAASAIRANQKAKAESVTALNKLADEKREILDGDLKFSAPGKQDEGDKATREYAAGVYIDAARESGMRAADLRATEREAAKHFQQNEVAYVDAAVEVANTELAAQGKELVQLPSPEGAQAPAQVQAPQPHEQRV